MSILTLSYGQVSCQRSYHMWVDANCCVTPTLTVYLFIDQVTEGSYLFKDTVSVKKTL